MNICGVDCMSNKNCFQQSTVISFKAGSRILYLNSRNKNKYGIVTFLVLKDRQLDTFYKRRVL